MKKIQNFELVELLKKIFSDSDLKSLFWFYLFDFKF